MSIIFFSVGEMGQDGETPRRNKLVVSDNLATLTAPAYLNNNNTSGKQVYPTDVFDVIYNYTSPPTFASASSFGNGTFQEFTVSINAGVITLQPLGFITKTVILSQAQVQAMYATPQLIVPAQGAGTVIVPVLATLYTNYQTAAFSAGGVGILQYAATADGAGTNALSATIPTAEITASSSQIYSLPGHTSAALTGISNAGLYLSNQTQAFAGGSLASTLVLTVNYQVIAAAI